MEKTFANDRRRSESKRPEMKKRAVLPVVFALLLLAADAALARGVWRSGPSLFSPRSAHAVVVAARAIHVLGGPGTRRVDRFDGRRWRKETRKSTPGEAVTECVSQCEAGLFPALDEMERAK